jgi:hypothetical protein
MRRMPRVAASLPSWRRGRPSRTTLAWPNRPGGVHQAADRSSPIDDAARRERMWSAGRPTLRRWRRSGAGCSTTDQYLLRSKVLVAKRRQRLTREVGDHVYRFRHIDLRWRRDDDEDVQTQIRKIG